ncbi:MAG: hypothetical protein AAGG68_15005, partial [Bacteroidota bacterium]
GNSMTKVRLYARNKQFIDSFLILNKDKDKETIYEYRFFFRGMIQILLDKKGTVVAVNPTEQQVGDFFKD